MKELFQLTGIGEAAMLLRESFLPDLSVETLDLDGALGRFLAEDILAPEDVPGFSRSTKDGYAVKAADTAGSSESLPGLLKVTGEILMGARADIAVGQGEAVKIATGGMLPEGADSVLMLEYTEEIGADEILVKAPLAPGENVILRGEDVTAGALLASAGRKIRPQEAGIFASQGLVRVPVYRRYRVGLLSTGNEVIPADQTPGPAQVRDVNSWLLAGRVRETGAEVIRYGISPDEYDALKALVEKALSECDMVLISGGSSVGTRDYCVQVLEDITGKPPLFHGIPLKPGKPALGAALDGKVILGLPGHPVSAATVFSLLARPLLTGGTRPSGSRVSAVLERNVAGQTGREDHIQVRLEDRDGVLTAVPLLGLSGMVRLLTEGDGEIVIPAPLEGLSRGTLVDVEIY